MNKSETLDSQNSKSALEFPGVGLSPMLKACSIFEATLISNFPRKNPSHHIPLLIPHSSWDPQPPSSPRSKTLNRPGPKETSLSPCGCRGPGRSAAPGRGSVVAQGVEQGSEGAAATGASGRMKGWKGMDSGRTDGAGLRDFI